MTVISTNVASLNAQAALATNARGLSKAMQQLSTGTRINSASDDAAGLAVSTRLTSQIRGLNTAVRNANDAISMIQTAEGAAVEITNMLQRMRELAVQSANDTNKDEDRAFLDLEFQQLKSEIGRIAETTQWNGMNILDGSFTANTDAGKFVFQVGANADQTVDITIGSFLTTDSDMSLTASSAIASDIQTTEVDLSTITLVEGDVISINAGGQQVSYKVTADDVADAEADSDNQAMATRLASAVSDAFGDAYTVTGTSETLTIVGIADQGTATFSFAVETNAGILAPIENNDVDDRASANSSITAIDDALTAINEQRATMGATVNRLQYTVDNLTNVSTKATESRSRVLDTDYSQATTELSKRQIISQAATAMLAQANQQPQTVLSLLK